MLDAFYGKSAFFIYKHNQISTIFVIISFNIRVATASIIIKQNEYIANSI